MPHRVHPAEHPDLKYGTAPLPVDDASPTLYGAGYVTGNIIGIPKGAKHPERPGRWSSTWPPTTDALGCSPTG